jgi:hypothetical protein
MALSSGQYPSGIAPVMNANSVPGRPLHYRPLGVAAIFREFDSLRYMSERESRLPDEPPLPTDPGGPE